MKNRLTLGSVLIALVGLSLPAYSEELYMVRIPTDLTHIDPAGQQAADAVDAQLSQLVFGKGVAPVNVVSADITLQCDRFTAVTVTKTDGSSTTEQKDAAVDFKQLNAFMARHRQVHAAYLSCDKTR